MFNTLYRFFALKNITSSTSIKNNTGSNRLLVNSKQCIIRKRKHNFCLLNAIKLLKMLFKSCSSSTLPVYLVIKVVASPSAYIKKLVCINARWFITFCNKLTTPFLCNSFCFYGNITVTRNVSLYVVLIQTSKNAIPFCFINNGFVKKTDCCWF